MGGLLINKTDGGEGASGAIRTPEHNAKIGASKVGKPRPNWLKEHLREIKTGVALTPEHRSAISKSQIGSIHTEMAKKKIGDAHRGKKISDKHKYAISLRLTGRTLPREHVDSMSRAVTLRYQSVAEREKTAKALRHLPPDAKNTSGYKGVSFRKDRAKWRASIKVGDKVLNLGVFDSATDAAAAYDAAAIAAWGHGNCFLNFEVAI